MLFPSINRKYVEDNCLIVCAIISFLLNKVITQDELTTIQHNIWRRSTYYFPTNVIDKRYFLLFWYDWKFSTSNNSTRIVMNIGFTIGKEKYGITGICGTEDQ